MPFFRIDFPLQCNRDITLNIAIQDGNQENIGPPFTLGKFAFALATPDPAQQGVMTPIVIRDSNGANVRFYNPPATPASPQWFMHCDILAADTLVLPSGTYYYESRLDVDPGKYLLKSGYFTLAPSLL
jgi:hypothetical protein